MWLLYAILSALSWALINVLDSSIVHHYQKKPMVLMWSQSLVSMPILAILAFTLPLETSWVWTLLVVGAFGYAGDVWFLYILGHLDVSITNLAWSFLSLLLAAAGFFLFGESWGVLQSLATVLIISGAFTLSYYHQRVDLLRILWLVSLLAVLFLPYYIFKKFVINEGVNPLTVFFWMTCGREIFSFSFGASLPAIRRAALSTIRLSWRFMAINTVVIVAFFIAECTGAFAYATGPLSLVSIVNNIQPFLVMGIAGLLLAIVPSKAAKELLTRQSIYLKIFCFLIVFSGMTLLAISH